MDFGVDDSVLDFSRINSFFEGVRKSFSGLYGQSHNLLLLIFHSYSVDFGRCVFLSEVKKLLTFRSE